MQYYVYVDHKCPTCNHPAFVEDDNKKCCNLTGNPMLAGTFEVKVAAELASYWNSHFPAFVRSQLYLIGPFKIKSAENATEFWPEALKGKVRLHE